jgi:limonene-1,2-epoxide hydrolase
VTGSSLRELVEAYARSRDPEYFALNATVEQMPLGRVLRGRAAIGAMLRTFYLETFSDPVERIVTVAVDDSRGIGVVESTFRGRHMGEAFGIAIGGTQIEVPMVGVYQIEDGLIGCGRLYFDVTALLGDLRRNPTP